MEAASSSDLAAEAEERNVRMGISVADADATPENTPEEAQTLPSTLPERTVLRTKLAPQAVLKALRDRSKRGRLAGFKEVKAGGADGGFAVDLFAGLYDRQVLGAIVADGDESNGSRVELRHKLKPVLPISVIAGTVFAIWPGAWFAASLLTTYFSWYPKAEWITYVWYIPLTLLTIPVLLKQFKQSELLARVEWPELLGKLVDALEAEAEEDTKA